MAPAVASGQDGTGRIFTTYGIEVDERAATAALARGEALARAERIGFRRLIEKLAGEDEAARVALPPAANLRAMVRSIEIIEERSSATRYLATLNVAFDPDRVRRSFGTAGVRYSELGSTPVLVLPLLKTAGARYLSGENNPWLAAWRAADSANRLVQYVIPQPGAGENVSGRLADLQYDPEGLKGSAGRAGADTVLIAVVDLVRPRVSPGQRVSASFTRPAGGETESVSVRTRRGEALEAVLLRLAEAYMDRADSRWRERTTVTFGEVFSLTANLELTRIEDWVEIRRAIAAVPIVRRLTVEWLALPVSAVTFEFVGGREQLRLSLSQEGLELTIEDSGNNWIRLLREEDDRTAESGEGEGE